LLKKYKMKLKKRISKKTLNILQNMVFFTSSITIIVCLIIYLWVYTEIDESVLALEIQNSTASELQNTIDELKNEIESLKRADAIAKKAKSELEMVFTKPETLMIKINDSGKHTL